MFRGEFEQKRNAEKEHDNTDAGHRVTAQKNFQSAANCGGALGMSRGNDSTRKDCGAGSVARSPAGGGSPISIDEIGGWRSCSKGVNDGSGISESGSGAGLFRSSRSESAAALVASANLSSAIARVRSTG